MAIRSMGLIALTLALLSGTVAQAQTARGGNWESTIQVVGTSSESSSGENGSSLDIDSDVGIGFGLHYNFSDHLALGFDMFFAKPRYEATFNTEEDGLVSVRHDMSVYNGQLNGTWNMLDGPFTPYLQLGIGWTYLDSNVADGPPVNGCWWDPWWGYVCRSFYSTYSETDFSYGVGAGLRWEFTNSMFIKASYNRVEVNASGSADPTFDSAKLELGWMFR